jgi:hypothetical protein
MPKVVNKFFRGNCSGAVSHSSLQLFAARLSLPVIFPKVSCYRRSDAKASAAFRNNNGNA